MPTRAARTCYAFLAAVALIAATVAAAVLATTRADATPGARAADGPATASIFSITVGPAAEATPAPSPADKPVQLRLSASSPAGPPVAGHGYQFYVDITNLAHPPDWDLRLFIGFSAGLTLAGGAPPGCFPVPGGLFCGYDRLAGEDSIPLTVNVNVAQGLRAGSEVGISASLHYDDEFSAHASDYRPVVTPTPTPTPTPTHTPTPTRTPTPPHHSHPGPPPPHRPVPPASHPAVAPRPPAPFHHPKPSPHPPKPAPLPVAFSGNPKRPAASAVAAPHPVLPIGVLLAAILTPCVAAAATRFGKTIHHR